MSGINEGWTYLNNAGGSHSIFPVRNHLCIVHDSRRTNPGQVRAQGWSNTGRVCLAAGCILAGLMRSYSGLIIGFGILGGIGMGIGYAAPTPAALKWFGPHKRGLIAGLVVGGTEERLFTLRRWPKISSTLMVSPAASSVWGFSLRLS